MNREEILAKVQQTLRKIKNLEKDKPILEDMDLVSELGVDSLDRFLLVDEMEESFDIEIEEDEMFGIHTVNDIVEKVLGKLNENE